MKIHDNQLIPVMLGLYPIFYLINVTRELSECVERSEKSINVTIIKKYIIPTMSTNTSIHDILLKNNVIKLASCYESFKKLIYIVDYIIIILIYEFNNLYTLNSAYGIYYRYMFLLYQFMYFK